MLTRHSQPLPARIGVLLCVLLLSSGSFFLHAQSTLGTVRGTVRDSSGAIVTNASVKITNLDEGTSRTIETDSFGNYEVLNAKPARYEVEVSKSGFDTKTISGLELIARQTLRADVTLEVGKLGQQINVEASAGVIATDTQTIASSYDSTKIMGLPGNFRASKDGTSPYTLIATLPGVQADNGNSFSIQGGIPSQSESSVDGIVTTDVTGNQPLRNAFPSAESIAEMRVEGVGTTAEYGQPGIITTVSKSGTNEYHGSAFWYHQNRALDAQAYGALTKPQKVANDYGVSGGGPVIIPHLYNGKNRSFFFGTFEGYKLPRGSTVQNRVPTEALRNGNFSGLGTEIIDPETGKQFLNNVIPLERISPVAQEILSLYPLPNAGSLTEVHDANYVDNRSFNYDSNQYDLRGDQYIGSKHSIYGRFTSKSINQKDPKNLLVPSSDLTERLRMLVVSHNYTITPRLLNEFRFGFTLLDRGSDNSIDGRSFMNSLGLQGFGPDYPYNGLPNVSFNDTFNSLDAERLNSLNRSRAFQFGNNLSWAKGRHSMKFGFDIRAMEAISPLGFIGGDNYGNHSFTGVFTGDPFADFLLGLPTNSEFAIVKNDNDGKTKHYAAFLHDSFKVNQKLTIELGMRYELHPPYQDVYGNVGNFDPSVPRSGRVIYPTGKESVLAPGYLASFNACPGPVANTAPCTPVVTAKEAGIPEALRQYPKLRFMPRFGFAYRPFDDQKTVFRGGFGIYNITVLGNVFYSLTGTLQSDARSYRNVDSEGKPIYQWPQTRTSGSGIIVDDFGTAYFGTANDINFKDPYSMQWNFSIDRDLGAGIGLRTSYIGMRTLHLVWSPSLNQMDYSTEVATSRPLSDRPFPNWGTVNTRSSAAVANYHALQFEANRRFRGGLTFTSAYTFSKNLSDNNGPNPASFAGETTSRASDAYNRRAEYGPVYGSRRHRWITTAIYDLPFGKGRQIGSNMNGIADSVLGGWRLGSIFLFQSGPWMTPYTANGDSSGTGSGNVDGRPQHPDRVASGIPQNQNRDHWFDNNAFACPGQPVTSGTPNCTGGTDTPGAVAPIGRFGNSGNGILEGPGTVNLSMSLSKYFSLGERFRLKAEGSFTNVLNHTNLADPQTRVDSNSFGVITAARDSEFGGNRTGQVSLRLEF